MVEFGAAFLEPGRSALADCRGHCGGRDIHIFCGELISPGTPPVKILGSCSILEISSENVQRKTETEIIAGTKTSLRNVVRPARRTALHRRFSCPLGFRER